MRTDELLERAKQQSGDSSVSSADQDFENAERARRVFALLKTKVLNIGQWNAHAMMSSYALFDETGKGLEDGKIKIGAFIRVQLKASGKYDWIRVVDFYEAADEFVVTVNPTFDPTAEKREEDVVSHFFTDESTNNFCLFTKDETVAFYVIGLNEKTNTSETGGAFETVRNVAVNAATYLGMQRSEWEKFCHHFLEDAAAETNTNLKTSDLSGS